MQVDRPIEELPAADQKLSKDLTGEGRSLWRRFATLHQDHKRIAIGAIWVGAFVLIAKLAAAGRDVAIAWRYGVSDVIDAYQLASTLVFWLPITLVSTLTVVLVPMLVRLRNDEQGRGLLLKELQGQALLLGGIVAITSVVLSESVIPYFTDRLSSTSRYMTWYLTVSMAPLALLSVVIGISSARLMAGERQINTLLEAIPAGAILLCVLFWPSRGVIAPLLWGTAIGTITHVIVSVRLAGAADSEYAFPRFSLRSPYWPEFSRALGIVAAGQIVMSLVTPLDQYSAGQHGDAAIATLGYATRLTGLLLGVGAMAFSRAALPVMSDLYVSGQTVRAEDISRKWAAAMLIGGLLVGTLAWSLAPFGIGLLFERGAFTSNDTYSVAKVFRWGLLQVPFYFAGLVLVQLLASRSQYAAIAFFAASNFVVKLILNATLSPSFGVAGIALATSLMYGWSTGCLWWYVVRSRERL